MKQLNLNIPHVPPGGDQPDDTRQTSEPELTKLTDLMARFVNDVERAGLVGETENAKIIFLAAVSAKLSKPLNVTVQGSSSAGKNYLMSKVAGFIPEHDQIFLTGMSPKYLNHCGKDEFCHTAVFIAEYEGVKGADYSIRTFQSEQRIEWGFTEASNKGISNKKRVVNGPAAFIQATTRATLHPENETRLLFVQMDESPEQTRAIMERQAAEAAKQIEARSPCLYVAWHNLLNGLEQWEVNIPFALKLFRGFPADPVRSRRDFPKLLALIEASAFLHQGQRMKDDEGNIIATNQDYQIAKELFEHCYAAGPDRQVRELVKATASIGMDSFTVAGLQGKLHWGKSKTYEVLRRAEECGRVAPDGWGQYKLLQADVEYPLNLPPEV